MTTDTVIDTEIRFGLLIMYMDISETRPDVGTLRAAYNPTTDELSVPYTSAPIGAIVMPTRKQRRAFAMYLDEHPEEVKEAKEMWDRIFSH